MAPWRPRVRFAPSPTGYLHVGGARTALFNWLYARRHGGTFVLRIEDTDVERSSADMVTGILDGLRWLGSTGTKGPASAVRTVRISSRSGSIAIGPRPRGSWPRACAYYCYCSPERLRAEREKAEQRGEAWQYDRACLALPPETHRRARSSCARRARSASRSPATHARRLTMRCTGGSSSTSNIEDFVVLRSDQHPTYHLSVVVDDVDMAITHVIRGDDHISNTPKHILLFDALGAPPPVFAHVPLILGADKKRLSKRHGATSVTEYRRQGYLPERDGELPRAAGLVAGRRPRADVDRPS